MSIHRIIAIESGEDWDIICSECNTNLSITISKEEDQKYIMVEPCKVCMDGRYEEGREDEKKES